MHFKTLKLPLYFLSQTHIYKVLNLCKLCVQLGLSKWENPKLRIRTKREGNVVLTSPRESMNTKWRLRWIGAYFSRRGCREAKYAEEKEGARWGGLAWTNEAVNHAVNHEVGHKGNSALCAICSRKPGLDTEGPVPVHTVLFLLYTFLKECLILGQEKCHQLFHLWLPSPSVPVTGGFPSTCSYPVPRCRAPFLPSPCSSVPSLVSAQKFTDAHLTFETIWDVRHSSPSGQSLLECHACQTYIHWDLHLDLINRKVNTVL